MRWVIRVVGGVLLAAVGCVLGLIVFCAVTQGLQRYLSDRWHRYGLDDPRECVRAA
jgi:hypothetical protein